MDEDFYSYFFEEDSEENFYAFTGKAGTYSVSFDVHLYNKYIENYPTLLQNACGLTIGSYGLSGQKSHMDAKIKATVCKIVQEFFDKNDENAVILYHCDYSDGKQAKRSMKFERWYRSSTITKQIYKYELPVELADGVTHYIGYLSKAENPNDHLILKEFEEFSFKLMNGEIAK